MKRLIPENSGYAFSISALARLINSEDALSQINFKHVDLTNVRLNTSAYRINTPQGLNSRVGILSLYRAAREHKWEPTSCLEEASTQFVKIGLTPFIAYQAAQDLKGNLLPKVPADFKTWTYWGIGALRGALRLLRYNLTGWASQFAQAPSMRGMRVAACPSLPLTLKAVTELTGATSPYVWAQHVGVEVLKQVPRYWAYEREWGLGEVEHMLCEFDKLQRWKEIGIPPGARRFKGER
jgi:hypothetical protein